MAGCQGNRAVDQIFLRVRTEPTQSSPARSPLLAGDRSGLCGAWHGTPPPELGPRHSNEQRRRGEPSEGTETGEDKRSQKEKGLAHQHEGKVPSLAFSTKTPAHCQ